MMSVIMNEHARLISCQTYGSKSCRWMGQDGCSSQCSKVDIVPYLNDLITSNPSHSPGYMLTKLTKTVLGKDEELKVMSSKTF